MRTANYFSATSIRKATYLIIVGLSVAMIAFGVILSASASALSITASRDCDDNAVIKCGAMSINELKQKYASTEGAPTIFKHFDIGSREIASLTNSNTIEGKVTKGGRVVVGDKTVATGAITAGRQNMEGSTAVTRNGLTFYERTPSASFQANSLKAFVVTDKDGAYLFAVIAGCGNPVRATPVPPKEEPKPTPPPVQPITPTPPPTPPAPTPPPAPAVTQQQQQQQTATSSSVSNATANVTINNEKPETPPPAPPHTVVVEKQVSTQPAVATPVAAEKEVVQELPKTGMESVSTTIGLTGVVALVSAVMHYLYTRKKYKENA